MAIGEVRLERDGAGIAVLRFDNPPHGFLDGAMTAALDEHLAALAQDDALRALILTGAQDGVLIRHFDLGELAGAAEAIAASPADPAATWRDSIFHQITRRLETLDVPVIAAINGDCMGVGFELALACDIRLARRGAYTIGLPEMHIAMFPGGGGTVRLARLLGPARALELIGMARVVDPEEAARLGMVNAAVDEPLDAALAMARKFASLSRSALAGAKRIVHASADLAIEDALTLEQRMVNARLGSAEVRAVLGRYAETGADLRRPLP
ncbi:enoyl-CoA hydratase/isomerase family protein [Novosphingobium sp. KCTC 2891]|uniref:enoyl-CoA hydratase/isomerase family protein n=1 Tax=Novosphingobium sp. KCTC 2891 TaxID=2989730 RepID=UPI002222E5BC|nr:enoyl-CoA hydratase/isomerase family protein [Novosphingobium sp. KCTC 2891]MCW1383868.1 enoyl-CoA hydratase/isomerase family protein [Novosphingobium sp. KCTC 2891]